MNMKSYMVPIKKLVFIVVVFVITTSEMAAQIVLAGDGEQLETLDRGRVSNSHLGADIAKHASLKLYLRKSEYRPDELLLVDIGFLGRSEKDVYFPTDLDIELRVTSKSDTSNRVKGLYTIDFVNPSFIKSKDILIIRTLKLVMGCQHDEAKLAMKRPSSSDNRVLFDNDLFQSLPDGCIDVSSPGDLEISADLISREIVVQGGVVTQTAVGSIQSNKLTIRMRK